jgi:hypothetical protein
VRDLCVGFYSCVDFGWGFVDICLWIYFVVLFAIDVGEQQSWDLLRDFSYLYFGGFVDGLDSLLLRADFGICFFLYFFPPGLWLCFLVPIYLLR